jgi:hypothetical protein
MNLIDYMSSISYLFFFVNIMWLASKIDLTSMRWNNIEMSIPSIFYLIGRKVFNKYLAFIIGTYFILMINLSFI